MVNTRKKSLRGWNFSQYLIFGGGGSGLMVENFSVTSLYMHTPQSRVFKYSDGYLKSSSTAEIY